MDENSNVVRLRRSDEIDDPQTDVLRAGARQLLARAIGWEVEAFLIERQDSKLPDGRVRLVRHGHGPEPWWLPGILERSAAASRPQSHTVEEIDNVMVGAVGLEPTTR